MDAEAVDSPTSDAIAPAGDVRAAVMDVMLDLRHLLREKQRLHGELADVEAAIAAHIEMIRDLEA